jgi:aspartate racemase
MTKHIIIIGGMGPQASVHAHKRLIELSQQGTAESTNDSYPRITHISINVKDFITGSRQKEEAREYILECLKDINFESVDTGFIACNTAHLLFDDIQAAAGGKLMSLIDVATKYIKGQKVGIVATPSTLKQNLYGDSVGVLPDDIGRKNIESIIRKVILGVPVEELVPLLRIEIMKLKNRGAEKVILGCSELSMFGKYLDPESIIDPIDLTIHELVKD